MAKTEKMGYFSNYFQKSFLEAPFPATPIFTCLANVHVILKMICNINSGGILAQYLPGISSRMAHTICNGLPRTAYCSKLAPKEILANVSIHQAYKVALLDLFRTKRLLTQEMF